MVTKKPLPAPPEGQSWQIAANHAQRELIVQLWATSDGDKPDWALTVSTKVGEYRTHLHWDTDQVRSATVDAMNAILHQNVTRARLDTFLQELEAEANNQ